MGNPRITVRQPLSTVTLPVAALAYALLLLAPSAQAQTYSTAFPLTENPISEGGKWINGGTTGIDWGDISTTPGQTHDHAGTARYADSTALLTGTWGADQMAQGTVYAGSTYNYPEVELRLRSSLSAHQCSGYEISFALSPNAYLIIVRWNGPLANYSILQNLSGPQYSVSTGDVVKATIVGSLITAFKNGVVMGQATDSTYPTGNPGMGFNEMVNGTYGYTSYSASDAIAGGSPPTVAAAAQAAPAAVTGNTTALSVLGADAGGEATLSYTWAASGAPPAPVAFSPNGTNEAKSSTATFTRAGTYTLQATITDGAGLMVQSSVMVTVDQALTAIAVTPGSASVPAGGSQAYAADATDQFGAALATQPVFGWSVSGGGTITGNGVFTAGSAAGGPFTVSAASGGIAGKGTVSVSAAGGGVMAINAGGPGVANFAADDDFSGGNAYSSSTAVSTAGIAKAAPAAVYQSERYANTMSYAIPGLAGGGSYTVRLHFAEIYWTAVGKRVFNVAINGTTVLSDFDIVAAAGGPGIAVVRSFAATASSSGEIVIAFTTVVDNAKLSGLEIIGAGSAPSPPTVATPAAAAANPVTGTMAALSVLGADASGPASLIYSWGAIGAPPAAVSFSANGSNAAQHTTATFTKAGSYTVQATITDPSGLSATSSVVVTVAQTLSALAVAPPSSVVAANGTQLFSTTAMDQFGAALATQPVIAWSVSGGGTISSSGAFTAGSTAGGPFTVTAASGGRTGTAAVTVAAADGDVLAINAGGPGMANFAADEDFSGGSTYITGASVSTAGIANAAPAAVYQSERYAGTMSYAIPGLVAGGTYTVRLHFAEIWWTAAGQRVFSVAINGNPVLSNFDILAAAGGPNIAVVRSFAATASAAGQIVIGFTTAVDNAKLSGLEIISGSGSTAASAVRAQPPAAESGATGRCGLGGGFAALVGLALFAGRRRLHPTRRWAGHSGGGPMER